MNDYDTDDGQETVYPNRPEAMILPVANSKRTKDQPIIAPL